MDLHPPMSLPEMVDERFHHPHVRVPRSYICPDESCKKRFNRKSDLQRHHRIHTNERPYHCNFEGCGKSFIQRSALTVHNRTHTGEKPHSCDHRGCSKRFSDSSSLARHRRIHTGNRPYRCPHPPCDKRFCRKTTMSKHASRAHRLGEGAEFADYVGEDEDAASETDGELEDSPLTATAPVQHVHWSRPFGPNAYQPDFSTLQRSHSMDQVPGYPPPPVMPPHHRGSYPSAVSYSNSPVSHMAEHVPNLPPDEHARSNSQIPYHNVPGGQIHTSMASEFQPHQTTTLKPPNIKIEAPGPTHLLAAAQAMQSSPSTLSSTQSSPLNSAHPQEMYYTQIQHPPLQNPHVTPPAEHVGGFQQYPHMQQPMTMAPQYPHQPVMAPDQAGRMEQPYHVPPTPQQQPPPPPQPQPQMYYDSIAYQEPVAVEVPPDLQYLPHRIYSIAGPPMDDDIWKHEDSNMITPSVRAAQGMHY